MPIRSPQSFRAYIVDWWHFLGASDSLDSGISWRSMFVIPGFKATQSLRPVSLWEGYAGRRIQ